METPWAEMKIAFDYSGQEIENVWKYLEYPVKGYVLPKKFKLSETDNSSTRATAIFDVEGIPTIRNGNKVKAILDKIAATE